MLLRHQLYFAGGGIVALNIRGHAGDVAKGMPASDSSLRYRPASGVQDMGCADAYLPHRRRCHFKAASILKKHIIDVGRRWLAAPFKVEAKYRQK